MAQSGERQPDRHMNPFATEKAIETIANALSIVLSEHYGEQVTVRFTRKEKGEEDSKGKCT